MVGAGPAGCAAGIVLARAGIDVCVIDRARFPRSKVCGDAVSNEGMALIRALGGLAAVEASPHALVHRAAAVFPDRTRIERDYEPPGYIVPRAHLDDCLRRALESTPARLIQGCNVSELVCQGEQVAGARGPELRWFAPLVIAADGYGSVGLPALGARAPRGRYLGISATAYFRGVGFPDGASVADHYFEAELPYGYGWIFPAVEGVSNLGVYLRADGYASSGRPLAELLRAFIARRADRVAGAAQVGKSRVWLLPLAPRPIGLSAPGLLLAGDAGGSIDPFTGEGIWQALHTGMLAGEIAAAAIRAGELTAPLRARYARACERSIGRSSRAKGWVQHAMTWLVDHELYRLSAVRAALRFGYRHRALEMTKS